MTGLSAIAVMQLEVAKLFYPGAVMAELTADVRARAEAMGLCVTGVELHKHDDRLEVTASFDIYDQAGNPWQARMVRAL